MEMVKVPATLDDGRKIAILVAAEKKDELIGKLIGHVTEALPASMPKAQAIPQQKSEKEQRRPQRRSDAGIVQVSRICRTCPTKMYYVDPLGWPICGACSCPIDHKILVANSHCPDGHWKAEDKGEVK